MFVKSFNDMAKVVHKNAKDKGFWDGSRNFGEQVALMHSELSEALEAARHGNPPDKHCPEFSNTEVELADTIIRIMDTSEGLGLRVAEALVAKVGFNATRPHMHGKKF